MMKPMDLLYEAKDAWRLYTDTQTFMRKWASIMGNTGTHNKENKTFEPADLKKEAYGWNCNLYAPNGLNFEQLDKLKPFIENNMPCLFVYTPKPNTRYAECKFITEPFKIREYKPIPTNVYENYIGISCDGSDVKVDMRNSPHILISGANGSGKSRLLDCILTTTIHNHSEKEVQLYLVQVAKNDLCIYEDCRQCAGFAEKLPEADDYLEKIIQIMDYRNMLIKPMRKKALGSDISAYNELYPQKPMQVIYVVFDEMASLMDNNGDSKQIKAMKQRIVAKSDAIAQYGRALGVFGIFCLQRPTAQMLSPFVKSQSNTRISFRQNNSKSSEVAMDDNEIALNLEPRVAVYKTFDYDYIKTPTISDKLIYKYIYSRTVPDSNAAFIPRKKVVPVDFHNVDSVPSVEENIKKISCYVSPESKGGKIKI